MYMWHIILSFVVMYDSVGAAWSEIVEDYECVWDTSWSSYHGASNTGREGYYMAGVETQKNGDDRLFKYKYCRSTDPNPDYHWTYKLPSYRTSAGAYISSSCAVGPFYSFSSVWSTASGYYPADRLFTPECQSLPPQYTHTYAYSSRVFVFDESTFTFECDHSLFGYIWSDMWETNNLRRYSYRCFNLINTPMILQSTAASDTLLCEIESSYSSSTGRITSSSNFGKPQWFSGNVVSSTYSIADSRNDLYFWVRVCPENGAFSNIVENGDSTLSFTCGRLIDSISADACGWTNYVGTLHGDFEANCPKDGVIRGIEGHYSASSSDSKYLLYCCDLKRESHDVSDTVIKLKTANTTGSETTEELTVTLCWDNILYQGFLVINGLDEWFATVDVVGFRTCGNERSLTIETDIGDDNAKISEIAVNVGGTDYRIHTFDEYASSSSTAATRVDAFSMSKTGYKDSVIQFPDDYLTGCVDSGCVGSLYPLEQNYLLSLHLCPSFTMASGDAKIGVLLRGVSGNLDKHIMTGRDFIEVPIGRGDIGALININIEHESGNDICIDKVTIWDSQLQKTEYAKEYFGDGAILSPDCSADGSFRLLEGIQYIPCHQRMFSIKTYQKALYTSVQIHSCEGTEGGIAAANTDTLSLTITGLSKSNVFTASGALSLQTSLDWTSGTSRDYTLPMFGEFESIAVVTITNNDATDALCVDSVLINGEEGYLQDYWVGRDDSPHSKATIAAVVSWPICKIELTTRVSAESTHAIDPVAVATSTCLNTNRLLSVDCEISQTFEQYEEISWQQELGQEVTTGVAIERGTETSVTMERSQSSSMSEVHDFGTETSVAANIKGVVDIEQTLTSNHEWGKERSWSSSNSNSNSNALSVGVSNSMSNLQVTTDGKVSGKTVSVECSGSVSVPPSQQVQYSLLIDKQEATITTSTDMKMTKCSAFLGGLDAKDPNNYIYVYGIKGTLKAKDSTNCYVSFAQATRVDPDPDRINCAQERSLATREWSDYVPQCNIEDPTKWKKCQCAYGDKWTEPTCGCVHEDTGNLIEDTSGTAAVVAETDSYKWTNWCTERCGADSFSLNAAAKFVPKKELQDLQDKAVDNVNYNYYSFDFGNYQVLLCLLIVAIVVFSHYVIKSCCSGKDKHKYGAAVQFDTEEVV